ncbi:MAG: DUF4276 family protein [Capsulimonadaceae bacterium]
MKITILVEGRTEAAFKRTLVKYLEQRLAGRMPKLDFFPYDGRIPKEADLKKKVENVLNGQDASQYLIALTDVYTGTNEFRDAEDAKAKMRQWVGPEPRFFPHVALYDFEAWLLPYWDEIKRLSKHNKAAPGINPETVNHNKPPSYHIKEVFAAGNCRNHYSKVRDGQRILRDKDLGLSIAKCAELKAFVNTLLRLSGGDEIP